MTSKKEITLFNFQFKPPEPGISFQFLLADQLKFKWRGNVKLKMEKLVGIQTYNFVKKSFQLSQILL